MVWKPKIMMWETNFVSSRQTLIRDIKTMDYRSHIQNTIRVVLDHLLGGVMFCILLRYNVFAHFFPVLFKLDNFIENTVRWFITYPAGFKFNENYNNFLSSLSLFFLHFWKNGLLFLRGPVLVMFNVVQILVLFCGFTSLVAFLVDLISVIFFPVQMLSVFFGGLERAHFSLIVSLFRVFMGSKYNPLRKRVDTLVYEQDNFLLGILFFVLLIFFLPCSFIYAYYFSILLTLVTYTQRAFMLSSVAITELPVNDFLSMFDNKYIDNPPKLEEYSMRKNEGKIVFDTCFENYSVRGGKTLYFKPEIFCEYKQALLDTFKDEEDITEEK
ncbi:hypothetical protein EIN_057990 [Entamoeba invadens IP1]|uniref:hypothetical protein n=1 Tax=Entamoeba invadens IP1 TaxID=370355 RepID=UPI0002C3EB1C|nr:hypothetical protein EIN_057990 [Entamoeba invadens IP1]ELP93384.1 hypothetical protein EIN_057990 [Entamoeba invadens IP1]|eukprot:XP_004260155.1 hypothetical protein EIN_057990 [Entamoeba invadens IP1]